MNQEAKEYAVDVARSFAPKEFARHIAFMRDDQPHRRRPAVFIDAVEAELKAIADDWRGEFLRGDQIWRFDSSGEAYDACQCRADIESGDVLLIESEGVVGLAWAWPVAISAANGALHQAKSARVVIHPDDMGASPDQLNRALRLCAENNFAIDPVFKGN